MLKLKITTPFVIFVFYFANAFENEHIWRSSFIENVACEAIPVMGDWCEWEEWGACDYTTCTRKRRRVCACPKPDNFSSAACPTVLPQDDIVIDNVSFYLLNRFK